MCKIRPYVALDLETTGLDTEKSQILQIGAVLDDGKSPIDQLERINILVENDPILYGEPYAMGLNAWILKELFSKESKFERTNPPTALKALKAMFDKAAFMGEEYDLAIGKDRPSRKAQVAGKNVGTFDLPIVRNQGFFLGLGDLLENLDHRHIDVGSMYYDEFGRNAGLNSINKLTGRTEVAHDALEDALDVVHAIRYKSGGKNE